MQRFGIISAALECEREGTLCSLPDAYLGQGEQYNSMKFEFSIEMIRGEFGAVVILPSESDVEVARKAAQDAANRSDVTDEQKAYLQQVADVKAESRELNLPHATIETFTITKPTYAQLQMAKLKHSKSDVMSGRTSVNEIGLIAELFPLCVTPMPTDATVGERLENVLHQSLYPDSETINFLLKRRSK